ncbi:MAG: hypothetical protein GY708_20235 [Actinomycetia bacterium]|nr:hypothetical protein [Actinomycetes bacterium]
MRSLAPIRIPLEVATYSTVEEAAERLHEATRPSRGLSLMAIHRVTGEVSPDRVVLQRHFRKSYGEFQGAFVEERGEPRLRGHFVEHRLPPAAWWIGIAVSVATLVHLIAWWWQDAPFEWYVAVEMGIVGVILTVLTSRSNRSNLQDAAELLRKDIDKLLNGPF